MNKSSHIFFKPHYHVAWDFSPLSLLSWSRLFIFLYSLVYVFGDSNKFRKRNSFENDIDISSKKSINIHIFKRGSQLAHLFANLYSGFAFYHLCNKYTIPNSFPTKSLLRLIYIHKFVSSRSSLRFRCMCSVHFSRVAKGAKGSFVSIVLQYERHFCCKVICKQINSNFLLKKQFNGGFLFFCFPLNFLSLYLLHFMFPVPCLGGPTEITTNLAFLPNFKF